MVDKYAAMYHYAPEIMKVKVVRETDKCVFFMSSLGNELRLKKLDTYVSYHDSFEETKNWLLEKAEQKLITARRKLERAQGEYGNVKGMKE